MEKQLRYRVIVLVLVFGFLLLVAAARLFELQIFHYDFYREKVEEQRMRTVVLSPPRGDIYDRNGELLAATVDSYSFFVTPKEVQYLESDIDFLAGRLGLKKEEVVEKLKSTKSFVWLKRKVDEAEALPVLNKNIKGIYALGEKKRIYPRGRLASTILGFVGLDNQGLAGIELSLDQYLRGREGRFLTEKDPRGHEMVAASRKIIEKPFYGMSVKLTIDANLQYVAESQLAAVMQQFSAKSGTILVLNVKTGELLAMASWPDFDPQFYYKSPASSWKSNAVAGIYEPGSTFKVITTASGLNEGVIDDKTRLKFLSQIVVGGKVIENSHPITKFGSTTTVSEMLQESINTGAVQIGLLLGPERFYKSIVNFGFGQSCEVGLPGEVRGIVKHYQDWYKPDIGMMTFGQSIAVTPLQLLVAIGAIANGGVRMQPFLIAEIASLDGKFLKINRPQVVNKPIAEHVARTVISMMEDVVMHGTGKKGQIADFRVAGKTGTAQKAIAGGVGYYKDKFVASYIGFAPASDPTLLVLVVVDDPKGCYWGETVAGPTFKQVMERSLRYLNVAPDKI